MQSWTLSLRPDPGTGLPAVDVVVRARPEATVADLARSFARHLAPDQPHLHLVPRDAEHPWPADRLVSECGLRTGDLLEVTSASGSWLTRSSSTARPRAVVRVVEGPDRGRRLHVRGTSLSIGRAGSSSLQLSDPLVSQHHARIVLGLRPVVHDEGSANGTRIGGELLLAGREIDWGTPITIGRSTLVIDVGEIPAPSPAVSVFRPPRFGDPLVSDVLDVPAPPTRNRPSPLPWAMLALPMVMGLAILARTRSPFALIYLLAWPMVGYAGWRQQRRQAERQFTEDVAAWRTDVDDVLRVIDEQAVAQRRQLFDDHPGADVVRARAETRDPYLWARSPDRDDFLVARVGMGSVPALLRGVVQDGGDRDVRRGVVAELARRDLLDDLPVLLDLASHPLVALTGPAGQVDALVRSLLLRLAFDHSPADLTFAACLGRGRSTHEAWLRWLPHAASRVGGESPVALGDRAAIGLLELLAGESSPRLHTLCLVDEGAGIPRRQVEAIASVAAERNLHLVWLGESSACVPAATSLLVDLKEGMLSVRDRGARSRVDLLDAVSLDECWRAARSMTGYVDEAAIQPASTAVPALVRLPEVSSDFEDLDDFDAVLQRWHQSTGLRAQIGTGVDGVVTIDLREDGPHGLVAGTTGSGKSELLQSLICSLALNNPPSRISFLLVDYKGGAAFRECADLPHTVGYITDLTPALVSRALTSLGAEINTREHLLGEYGVKDIVQLEREHPEAAPPSLLICVDEFAALTSEVPEFVDGMVNIAQRGRSLGMHVLLATQRPAGVVTGNIRANADLRIALRVSSPDDSRDVLDSPEAAQISRRTPGRAWIRRTGHGSPELVQSAWTGAREPLSDAEDTVHVQAFSAATDRVHARPEDQPRLHARTDLERSVSTIQAAFESSGRALPGRPWLPPLPDELLLDAAGVMAGATGNGSGLVVVGRVDDPARQQQPELVLDLRAVGHVLVHGASGSGKTEFLRTAIVAASLGDTHSTHAVAPYVYGLDFAGGGLSAVSSLPTVAAIVPESAPGRVQRLIRLLRRTMQERTQALAHHGCSDLEDLARAGRVLPRVYVAIDNLPALVDSLESAGGVARDHVEQLQSVLQNGRRVGIHVIATAPGRTGVPTSLGATFGRRLVLRMTTADDYLMLGVPGNVLDPESAPGSGMLGRSRVQVSTCGGAGTPLHAERINEISELLAPAVSGRVPAPVPAMPSRLDQAVLPVPRRDRFALAVDADAVAVIEVDLLRGPILVAGRAGSGRTSALDAVVAMAGRGDAPPDLMHSRDLLSTAAELRTWLEENPEGSASWALVLVDDAQVWDTDAGVDEGLRSARDFLVRAIGEHGDRVAAVVAADTAEVRRGGTSESLLSMARNGRRGFLLQPEWNDGDLFGVAVPTKSIEPLTGPGRGLWCDGGAAWVAQLVTGQNQDERGAR